MSKNGKLSAAEAKMKKKEYDRKRRDKLKNCPGSLEKLREKERVKYLNKKKKGQVKSVSAMSSRERRQKRKQWRLNSLKYREKNEKVRKNLARLMDETPPASPVPSAGPSSRVNAVNDNTVALRRRRELRKRRGILYGRIAKLRQNLKEEIKKSERYRKRYTRLNNRIKTSSPENTPTDTPTVSTRRKKKDINLESDVKISETTPSEKSTYDYEVGDHVLITWNNEVYPGKIISLSDDGALVYVL